MPGVSTATSISETSGRGVGMDVVKRNVERLGGAIQVHSQSGKGSEFRVRIPLTLAIIPALLVRIGRQRLAVPLSAVEETMRIRAEEISSVEGFEIISIRQKTLPLIRLGSIFRGTGAEKLPKKLFVVIVRHGDFEAGLGVEGLLGQQEVVIKPLADYLTDQPGFSGATILGDGSVALILDIPIVLDRARDFIARRQKVMEQDALDIGELSGMIH
jgi:two-component system chemotaxis sensor kinase CheA